VSDPIFSSGRVRCASRHSAELSQYHSLEYSDDETDAIELAQLLARNIAGGTIYPVEERGVRDLPRRRLVLKLL